MNELQQVLLVFAVVVIAGLYFLSRSRQAAIKKESPKSKDSQEVSKKESSDVDESTSYQKASQALNDLGEPHIPVSKATENRINKTNEPTSELEVNENQGLLPFGEEFDLPLEKPFEADAQKTMTSVPKPAAEQSSEQITESVEPNQSEATIVNELGGKHHVLVVDDPGMVSDDYQYVAPETVTPSFGIPEEDVGKSPGQSVGEKKDPEIFVIMVMSTGQEFSMLELNKALLGVGLVYVDNHIYVKRDNMGNNIIKVANLMEPGIFPSEDLQNYTTAGVAMILELPSSVRAPAAMHDLIMMARKVSQRLQGRLYNMERHLIKESDLQSMRDAAVEYESEPL